MTTNSDNGNNPLMREGLPKFEDIAPGHALPAIQALVAKHQALIDEIASCPLDQLSHENVLWAETIASEALANAWSTIGHLHRVMNSQAWREAFQECLPIVSQFSTERAQNPLLYRAYQTLTQRADHSEQPEAVQVAIAHQLRDFRLSGVDQPSHIRDELKAKTLRLSELSNTFGNHVMDATDGFRVTFSSAEELQGLPEDALLQMADRAKADGQDGYVADLSMPSHRAIMTYADDRQLRARFHRAYATRASDQGPQAGQFDNTQIVQEMLAIRHEIANTLGFQHHGDYTLQTRMAESVEAIEAFLQDLANRAKPVALTQLAAVSEFAKSEGATLPLEPWDVAYYTEKFRDQSLGINDERLKPYFEVQAVFGGLFDTAQRLFGVRFEKDPTVSTWHEQVSFYWMSDATGQVIAGLYLDIYARPKKAGGAWMDVCRSKMVHQSASQIPIAYLTCNFAPPSKDAPSLLTHDDVVTLFHEFGHCLHHLLTRVELPAVAGIHGVEWDAVELPSQLLEGWSLASEALNTYAHHFETKQPLPAKELQSLRANRQFQGALALLRQIQFALTDLALHTQGDGDPVEIARRIEQQISVMPSPDYTRFIMGFSHLFNGGYSAGYYSYLWAERLARDAFDLFEKKGVYDESLGQRLADSILSVGGSRPMAASWQEFAGQPARLEPLLAAYGIEKEAA